MLAALIAICSIRKTHRNQIFLENVKNTGELIKEKPYIRYSIDLLKNCFLKTLSYDNYDSDTIMYLVTYVNKLDNFDSNLNFIPLLKIKEQRKDKAEYAETVKIYFSDLLGLIGLLDELNDKIANLILKFLRKSDFVNLTEHLESLHKQQSKPKV